VCVKIEYSRLQKLNRRGKRFSIEQILFLEKVSAFDGGRNKAPLDHRVCDMGDVDCSTMQFTEMFNEMFNKI
jgi:hypothetical protein